MRGGDFMIDMIRDCAGQVGIECGEGVAGAGGGRDFVINQIRASAGQVRRVGEGGSRGRWGRGGRLCDCQDTT